mmetsp:Transcript_12111/g.26791  ORF Transcript_12111/g.26791 Transcript_12111/m.26791 type:complete len:212 (+) Transcript_12111:249-884(+)
MADHAMLLDVGQRLDKCLCGRLISHLAQNKGHLVSQDCTGAITQKHLGQGLHSPISAHVAQREHPLVALEQRQAVISESGCCPGDILFCGVCQAFRWVLRRVLTHAKRQGRTPGFLRLLPASFKSFHGQLTGVSQSFAAGILCHRSEFGHQGLAVIRPQSCQSFSGLMTDDLIFGLVKQYLPQGLNCRGISQLPQDIGSFVAKQHRILLQR